MMNRNEAIQTLSKVGKISVSYAEDLYDSIVPKPVVPQYVADWYEEKRDGFVYDYELFHYFSHWDDQEKDDFKKWIEDIEDEPIKILVNMHQFGYEVEKEPRYTVRIKGVDGYATHLNENLDNHEWFFASDDEIKSYRIKHTRKELESNGFGWVFSCEGVEVKEVE
ncbi:MAG: DUF1642 domain-containing protein [Streptococcus sp.]|nr:DUF1642 domain-containing protein [Streptococcus sp.]